MMQSSAYGRPVLTGIDLDVLIDRIGRKKADNAGCSQPLLIDELLKQKNWGIYPW